MSATVQEYKCPCCGGAIEFDSSLQKMKCPFCDTEFELDTLKDFAADLEEDKPDEMDWDTASEAWTGDDAAHMAAFVCKSCAGQIIADETTAATFCPFCGNPVVMAGRLSGVLRPDLVIPFKVDKEAAIKALSGHLEGKRLLPKAFKDQNHLQEIRGVYVPFWLYDADADASIRYRATRVRHWSDSRYDYTETSYFSVFRRGGLTFDHVPVDGSEKMPDDLMESIEPFDYSEAVDFNTAYLSGFFADKYDVTADACRERANERVRNSTVGVFADTVHGYTTVKPEYTHVSLKNGKVRYALLPVWILNTDWNGKKYIFAMNGQTGKFVGNLPMDKTAYALWFGGLTAAVTAGVVGLSLLLHML